MKEFMFLLISILLSVLGQILLKMGAVKIISSNLKTIFLNHHLFFGLFCYFISALFYILCLRKMPLSIAYPSVSSGYILIMIFSYFLFDEAIHLQKIFAMILIILGIGLLYAKN